MKLSSWPKIGSDGDVLLMPYVPKGITGYDDDDDVYQTVIYRITSTKCHINTVVSPDDGHTVALEIVKYSKNKLCTKLVLFGRLNCNI